MGLDDMAPWFKGCKAANKPLKKFPEAKGEQTLLVVSESGVSFTTGLGGAKDPIFIEFYKKLQAGLPSGCSLLVRPCLPATAAALARPARPTPALHDGPGACSQPARSQACSQPQAF